MKKDRSEGRINNKSTSGQKRAALRKRAEQALRDTEARYQSLVDLGPDAILVHADGKYVYANQAGTRLFGAHSSEDVIGSDVLESIHPDHRQYMVHRIEEACGGAVTPLGEIRFMRLDGSNVDTEVTCRQVEFSGKRAIEIVARDITERKRAESHVQREMEYKDFLLLLHEKAPQLSDKELYDYVLEEIVRLTDSIIGFFHRVSDDQKTVVLTTWNSEALKNCTASYETHYLLEQAGNWVDCVRFRHPVIYNDFPHSPNQKGLPDGHAPVGRFMSVPVMEGDKVRVIFGVGNRADEYDESDALQIQLVANTLHAIMKGRRAETALRKAHDELDQRVQERTAELSKAVDTLHDEIDARRKVEEDLARQAELLNLTHDAIIARDLNQRVFFWNRGAQERYGWSSDEVKGKVTDGLLQTVYPRPRQEIEEETPPPWPMGRRSHTHDQGRQEDHGSQ